MMQNQVRELSAIDIQLVAGGLLAYVPLGSLNGTVRPMPIFFPPSQLPQILPVPTPPTIPSPFSPPFE